MDKLRVFYITLKSVIHVFEKGDMVQADEVQEQLTVMENMIEGIRESIALSKPKVAYLCDMYDTFERELYKSKGDLDCVSKELYTLLEHTEVCLGK